MMVSLRSGFARAGATGQTSPSQTVPPEGIDNLAGPCRCPLNPATRSIWLTLTLLPALLPALSLALPGALLSSDAYAQETPIAPPPETAIPSLNDPAPANPPSAVPDSVEESVGVEADALVAESSHVALAQFTTAIEEREPIDQVSFIGTEVQKIYFFTDLREMAGTVVTHKWIHDGNVMAEVDFAVKGPRWRVWSSKELDPKNIGDWTVEVVTSDGEVLASETLTLNATS